MKLLILLLSSFFIFTPLVQAASFDPDFIISDDEINNYNSMTIAEIDAFLRSKNSYLAYNYFPDFDGITRTVPEIIWLASQRYQINPKYTLVLLQKEQSLIERANPTEKALDWATGYAVCDSCKTTDSLIQKYRGFGKQVDNGVGFMRFFFDNPHRTAPFLIATPVQVTDYNSGTAKSYTVAPVNQSTANLYKYTPHYAGNLSFWKIWQRYFAQEYPNGTLVKLVDDPTVWLLQDGERRPFKSFGILASRYNPNKIVTITKADLDTFIDGKSISFPQYSYLRSPSGTVFLIIDDKRYGFESSGALRVLGINPEEIVDVTDADLEPYEEGESITVESAYPTGALLKDTISGSLYYVQNGKRSPIYATEILDSRFPNARVIPVHPDELSTYELSDPIPFLDGELVKMHDNPKVYIIESGKRRLITSGERFVELGFNWNNIISTDFQTIMLHSLGADLN